MKQRILTGWTFTRVLYASLGIAIIIGSLIRYEWIGVLFGGYFASMGIFSFGCAAGNCYTGNRTDYNTKDKMSGNQEIEFEEIKTK